jgi:peroxiredoxin
MEPAHTEPNQEVKMALKVGQPAPNFTLENHLDGKTSLFEFMGKKNVVLAFFPLAWTPI